MEQHNDLCKSMGHAVLEDFALGGTHCLLCRHPIITYIPTAPFLHHQPSANLLTLHITRSIYVHVQCK